MSLTLYHSPLSCSVASRFALAEAGIDHSVIVINVLGGEQHDPSYRAINPRGRVPALVTSEGILTESTAMLPYIADLVPGKRLLPKPATFERGVAQSWLSFLSSTVHAAFAGAFRPDRLSSDPSIVDALRAAHLPLIVGALGELEVHLASREYLLDEFSVCDVYALVFLLWRNSPIVAGKLPQFPALDTFQARLLARPAVAEVMADDQRLFAVRPAAQHVP